MELRDKIIDIINRLGHDYTERIRTINTDCPSCGRRDKFSIFKNTGVSICYHGSCEFGKKWFEDWVAAVAEVSRKEAKQIIHGKEEDRHITDQELLDMTFKPPREESRLVPVKWPDPGMLILTHPEAIEGANYVLSRGIPLDIAERYDIRYSPFSRRVLFPVKMDGECYGWQGRAIDKVDDADKVRSNDGLQRDSVVMFYDNVVNSDHIIITEGPVDAIKFDLVGGNVATMGKGISKRQIDLINNSGTSTAYLGLDQDASFDAIEIAGYISLKKKILFVPDSCIERCKSKGKKPDFGECTFEEAKEAFITARNFDPLLLVYFK